MRNVHGWQALNPAIYLISILPGIGVWLLAKPEGQTQLALFVATFAVVLIQHAINLLNDVADWKLGADVEKWDSWVRFHNQNLSVAIRHGWFSFIAGGLLGLATLVWLEKLWIVWIALPLVGLGYLYNSGQKPLSYSRSGEWVTAICYGGVFSCLWLVSSQELGNAIILGSLSFGSLAVALLLAHQPDQINTDRRANKYTFAVRFGAAKTYQMVRVLFLIFLVTWIFLSIVTLPLSALPILSFVLVCLILGSSLYKKAFKPLSNRKK
ncbi:MAG: prenyltransferase [Methylococcaceae bacterium]